MRELSRSIVEICTLILRRREKGREREEGGKYREYQEIFERNILNYLRAVNFTHFNLLLYTESLLPQVLFRRNIDVF